MEAAPARSRARVTGVVRAKAAVTEAPKTPPASTRTVVTPPPTFSQLAASSAQWTSPGDSPEAAKAARTLPQTATATVAKAHARPVSATVKRSDSNPARVVATGRPKVAVQIVTQAASSSQAQETRPQTESRPAVTASRDLLQGLAEDPFKVPDFGSPAPPPALPTGDFSSPAPPPSGKPAGDFSSPAPPPGKPSYDFSAAPPPGKYDFGSVASPPPSKPNSSAFTHLVESRDQRKPLKEDTGNQPEAAKENLQPRIASKADDELARAKTPDAVKESRTADEAKIARLEEEKAELKTVLKSQNDATQKLWAELDALKDEKTALEAKVTALEAENQTLKDSRKVGWSQDTETAIAVPKSPDSSLSFRPGTTISSGSFARPETTLSLQSRPMTSASINSWQSAASQASLVFSTSAKSLRSVAEWIFPLPNRVLPPEKPYDRSLLPANDPRRQWLEEYMKNSLMSHRTGLHSEQWCEPPEIEIVRVSEIMNPVLNTAYCQQLAMIQEAWSADRDPTPELEKAIPVRTSWNGPRMNEALLFHGCKWDAVFGILREGFDTRLGGTTTGAAFGIGSYFTSVASKADGYTECWQEWDQRPQCDIPAELRCMLIARVTLGEIYESLEADSSLRRPPQKEDGSRYDSVLGVPRQRGGCVDYDEFIIYKQTQAVPQFIVDYRHSATCRCRACWQDDELI